MAARKPSASWQDLRKVPAPARRVFSLPIAARLGAIEHGFNPPPNAAGSLRFPFPDRLKDFEYMRRFDLGKPFRPTQLIL